MRRLLDFCVFALLLGKAKMTAALLALAAAFVLGALLYALLQGKLK